MADPPPSAPVQTTNTLGCAANSSVVQERGWTWRGSDNGTQVYSYPSIAIGAKPWAPGRGNDRRFPRRTASASAVSVVADISTEIMIWSDYTPAPISNTGPVTERGQITVDGRTWRVFSAGNWGDTSGGTAHRWTFIVYAAIVPSRTLAVDVRRFIDDAIARGLLNPALAVANVELGNEISSGTTWVRSFSVTVP